MSNPSITADKTPWYQWDTGLTVTVSGGEMTECHFANRKQGTAYVQAVINGVARVPDELLQVAAPIKAYGYVSDGAGGQTYVEQTFDVIARNIPADYTYTKTAQKTIRDAEAARDQAVQAAKDAKASELAADDSAVEASNSAQSAGESASAAATSASNAAKSAGDAAKSASDAKIAADNAVEDASDLLKTYTDNAKTSADNAATSASNAADSASAASGSASAAEQSATDASNAKVAAESFKAGAEAAKGEAAASAGNAAASATAAAKSASDAAASVDAINVIAPRHTATSATAENTALAIGNAAHSYGSYSIAIGASSDCGNGSSVAIGDSARTTRDTEFSIGSISGGRYLANVKSPELDTDASNKKYTDDNDANTLVEAKKYTDANTSNALVGTVSGKLLHVEDAWPSSVREFVVYGKSVQDGTPTPDAPVPIESVSKLSVTACGKNLIKYPYSDTTKIYNGVTFTDIGDGRISVEGTNTSTAGAVFNLVGKSDEEYIMLPAGKYIAYAKESSNNDNIYLSIRRDTYFGIDVLNSLTINQVPYKKFTISEPTKLFIRIGVFGKETVAKTTVNVSLCASEDTDPYLPYIGSTTPNLLVSEDGTAYELRSLPDGTRDELVVKDGRRVLVKRVGSVVLDGTEAWDVQTIESNGMKIFYIQKDDVYRSTDYRQNIMSDCLDIGINHYYISERAFVSGYGRETAYPGQNWLYVFVPGITLINEMKKFIAEHKPTVNYRLAIPEIIDLGPADPIALPETISNVWVDANLTPECAMTYKRDINVAFENIVQAVVAAAAGE